MHITVDADLISSAFLRVKNMVHFTISGIVNWNTFYAFVCLFPIYLARLYPF